VLKTVQQPRSNGGIVPALVPLFPFYWCKDHYNYEPKDFDYSYARLTKRGKEEYDKLWNFVDSFVPAEVVDEKEELVLDSRGNRFTERRLINTHDLVFFCLDFLGS